MAAKPSWVTDAAAAERSTARARTRPVPHTKPWRTLTTSTVESRRFSHWRTVNKTAVRIAAWNTVAMKAKR